MTSSEVRRKFIEFYKGKDHVEIPNHSLIPENDPTTLFIGSGMQPLVPYLLGDPHPLGKRLVNVQRSLRAEDLDEVGNGRHHTFFEMLGCWSLGDYFKKEQNSWTFEFFVDELRLNPGKLYVSVFKGDENAPRDNESVETWKEVFGRYGIEAEDSEDIHRVGEGKFRIFYYPRKNNWWERPNAPAGDPAGPDTEVFYDTGKEHLAEFGEKCHINCECGKFVEIGNNVYMEYRKGEDGSYSKLESRNVDVGWGLERIVRVVQGKDSNFETDLFLPIVEEMQKLSKVGYGQSEKGDWIYRVISDHIRAACFLISDGVMPSNKAQGYVLRRLLRRVIRFSRELEAEEMFLSRLARVVVDIYSGPYPDLDANSEKIYTALEQEEKKFQKALNRGLKQFNKLIEGSEEKVISGKDAFFLYETYGFPLELTEELAEEKGFKVDKDEFDEVRREAVEKSKKLDKGVFSGGLGDRSEKTIWFHTLTHLLHQALIDVLGDHVRQAGSNITPKRLRFDFFHDRKMADDQIVEVERIVNEKKNEGLNVSVEVMDLQEALDKGAKAFFKEKYPDKVNVYSVGAYSKEICQGPHVENTAEIEGEFKIVKERSVGAGVRRIRAIIV